MGVFCAFSSGGHMENSPTAFIFLHPNGRAQNRCPLGHCCGATYVRVQATGSVPGPNETKCYNNILAIVALIFLTFFVSLLLLSIVEKGFEFRCIFFMIIIDTV